MLSSFLTELTYSFTQPLRTAVKVRGLVYNFTWYTVCIVDFIVFTQSPEKQLLEQVKSYSIRVNVHVGSTGLEPDSWRVGSDKIIPILVDLEVSVCLSFLF